MIFIWFFSVFIPIYLEHHAIIVSGPHSCAFLNMKSQEFLYNLAAFLNIFGDFEVVRIELKQGHMISSGFHMISYGLHIIIYGFPTIS